MDQRKLSSLDAENRLPEYAKDQSQEDFIFKFNLALQDLETQQLSYQSKRKSFPTILIVGAPRTGSTLLTQVLASRLDVGYVSNLMARFYNAPSTGARLQKLILGNQIHNLRSYTSVHGVTSEVYEPHEFGYFWSRHLAFDKEVHEPINENEIKKVNFNNLKRELDAIAAAFEKPTLMKCPLGVFFLRQILESSDAFIIHLKRDFEPLLKSILKVRSQRLGSEDKWWSIRPANFEQIMELSPTEQVKWQIGKINAAIEQGKVGYENRVIECDYEDFIQNPEKFIDSFLNTFSKYSRIDIQKVGTTVDCFNNGKR